MRRHSSTRAISSSAAPSAPPQSSAAQSLRVTPLKVGDSFSSTTTLRLAAERMLLAQGRTLVSDHRVTGGHQRMYRCSAAKMVKGQKGISGGCPVFRQSQQAQGQPVLRHRVLVRPPRGREEEVEPSRLGRGRRGRRQRQPQDYCSCDREGAKGTFGVELQPHTANRLKRGVVGVSQEAYREGYQRLESSIPQPAHGR